MYLAKKHGSSSYPVIGEYFGMKSHSTVISACRRIEKLRRSDRQLSLDLEEIEKNLK
jgi:chromosomal replication initiation ATPase DnaA